MTQTVAAHTPGPWTITPAHDGFRSHIFGPLQPQPLGGMYRPDIGTVRTTNAHLIAAAPELLAAIEDAMVTLEIIDLTAPHQTAVINSIATIRAAIAKAKGGAA